MTIPEWVKIDEGHYAVSAGAINGKQSFVHVEGNSVYLTDGTYSYKEIIRGDDRKKFLASAKMFAAGEKPKRRLPKISKKTQERIKTTAKVAARGAGKVIGTVRAFTTMIGEAEEEAYRRRAAAPTKKRQPVKRKRQPAKRRREPTLKEWMGY